MPSVRGAFGGASRVVREAESALASARSPRSVRAVLMGRAPAEAARLRKRAAATSMKEKGERRCVWRSGDDIPTGVTYARRSSNSAYSGVARPLLPRDMHAQRESRSDYLRADRYRNEGTSSNIDAQASQLLARRMSRRRGSRAVAAVHCSVPRRY